MNLYQRILNVQESIGTVHKTGWNTFQSYHYVTEADLLDAIRKHLVTEGLALILMGMEDEIGQHPDGKRWAKVKVNFRLVNVSEPEEFIDTDSVGYAEDNGDKAIFKAITGASKYLYYKLFLVSTGDDPERDEAPAPQRPQNRTKPMPPRDIQAGQPKLGGWAEECKLTGGKIKQIVGFNGWKPEDVHRITGLPSIKELVDSGTENAAGLLGGAWMALKAAEQKQQKQA